MNETNVAGIAPSRGGQLFRRTSLTFLTATHRLTGYCIQQVAALGPIFLGLQELQIAHKVKQLWDQLRLLPAMAGVAEAATRIACSNVSLEITPRAYPGFRCRPNKYRTLYVGIHVTIHLGIS
jgi:hypothetical protein